MDIVWDDTDFKAKAAQLLALSGVASAKALNNIADEVLRLSQKLVPHNIGTLQNSGHVDPTNPEDVLVGYNTPYAAKLHEHPEYRFQKGREGKYLEKPIIENMAAFLRLYNETIQDVLAKKSI